MKPIGVLTNGIGEETRQHLNLSRSLADFDEFRPIKTRVSVTKVMPRKAKKAKPAPIAPAGQSFRYRLKMGAAYLARDKATTTRDPGFAWSGTAEQALKVCSEVPIASSMLMELQ
jgi:hypothetical protein